MKPKRKGTVAETRCKNLNFGGARIDYPGVRLVGEAMEFYALIHVGL
jgi:hypothetical protein